jgi:hypothetical protein
MQCLDLPKVPESLRRMTSEQAENRRYRKVLLAGSIIECRLACFQCFQLCLGAEFIIYLNDGREKQRVFWVDPDLKDLYWGKHRKVQLPSGRFNVVHADDKICLKDIKSVVVDRKRNPTASKVFISRFSKRIACFECCTIRACPQKRLSR